MRDAGARCSATTRPRTWRRAAACRPCRKSGSSDHPSGRREPERQAAPGRARFPQGIDCGTPRSRGRRGSAGRRPRRRFRKCPARYLASRCRSMSPQSSGRSSSGPCDPARGSVPRLPTWARGSSSRSARAGHPRGCGTRPPACPIAPAASDRLRASSARQRSRRRTCSRAPRARCRRRPRGHRGAPPPLDRGCSSACAARLR